MKKDFLEPVQLIAMIDYPPLHSPEAFAVYREKLKLGTPVEPIIVVPLKTVVDHLSKNEAHYATYKEILDHFLADHSEVKYFMTGGKHRSAAATILGQKIHSYIIENEADVDEINSLINKGEITGVPPVSENFIKTLDELEAHYFEHKRFWAMDEKTKAMIKNGDIIV
ncbi:MAG: hypothetical protein WCT40_04370 [Candidatus Magasanikbacteria bacterium]|jgi:hypothetical protein